MGTAAFYTVYGDSSGSATIEIVYFPLSSGGATLGRSNYLGVAGGAGSIPTTGWDQYKGVFWNRSKTNMAHITDGTSNTLLFGENVGFDDQILAFSSSWMGGGFLGTFRGLAPLVPGKARWSQFGSMHPGVVQFTLADGSVRPLLHTVDALTHRYWSSMSEGQVTAGIGN